MPRGFAPLLRGSLISFRPSVSTSMSNRINLAGVSTETPLSSGFGARKAALSLLAGFATAVASGGAGFSASTSVAGLSSRNFEGGLPNQPVPVQPANSISATRPGLVQFTFASLRGASVQARNGVEPIRDEYLAARNF
jgi:hypothetical protein